MWTRLRHWLKAPIFESDEEKTRNARLLNAISLSWLVVIGAAAIAGPFVFTDQPLVSTIILWVLVLFGGVVQFLMRRGRVRDASIYFLTIFWITITLLVLSAGSIKNAPETFFYITITVMAGLLLGERIGLGVAGFSALVSLGILYLENTSYMPSAFYINPPLTFWVELVMSLALTSATVSITMRSLNQALEQARREIVERKQAEAQVQRLVSIPEHSSDFISMVTPEGEGLYINSAGLSLTGYTEEEFYSGLSISDFQPDLPLETLEIVMREGVWTGENTLKHKDGHLVPISQTITVVKDETGNVLHLATIARDITLQKEAEAERTRLQQEIIEAQQQSLRELSSPVIPVMEQIIVVPLVGTIDTQRAQDIMRRILWGINEHRARFVILDVTGVPIMDTGVVSHLDKTIQAAQLKGAKTIITGISDATAESIVDLGIDWNNVRTLSDLRTGLMVALREMEISVM